MTEQTGSCACGAIHFKVTAPLMGVGACHCTDCQKASGGGPNYVALAPKDAFEVTKGEAKSYASALDSGGQAQRFFCGDCGTPLWSVPPEMPFLTVKVGAFDQTSELVPQMHIYVSSAQPWHQFQDGLPKFEKMPPEG